MGQGNVGCKYIDSDLLQSAFSLNSMRYLTLAVAFLLAGCVPLKRTCYEGKYPGLRQCLTEVAQDRGTLRILMIHGMSNHDTNWSDKPIAGLLSNLPVTRQNDDRFVPLPPTAIATNFLKTNSYIGPDNRVIKVYEVTWTPSTINLKNEMFLRDGALNSDRVWVNKKLKNDTINDGFGDAVLYLNPNYKKAMQKPIEDSIKELVKDLQENDQIILISASLGSKMTFDTVNEHLQAESKLAADFEAFAAKTTHIIMLANQIPLLLLGDDNYDPLNKNLKGWSQGSELYGVEGFIKAKRKNVNENARIQILDPNPDPLNCPLQIIAATDPNDLLSYPVMKDQLVRRDSPAASLVNVQNVYIHNASAILGVFVWPSYAHTGHPDNKNFVKKLTDGWTDDGHCFVKPVALDRNE